MDHTQLDPKQILAPERFVEYEKTIAESERLRYAGKLITRSGMRILDIGGASGFFLHELEKSSTHKCELFNMDVDDFHQQKQISRNIQFIRGSILDSGLPDNSFDIVTFRHILHHLIGRDLEETLGNQRWAIEEIFRITAKGGYVLFEEEVNNVLPFTRMVYYLSKLANRYGIKSKTFDAGEVIVSFMTPAEVEAAVKAPMGKHGLEVVKHEYVPWTLPWKWRLTLLMASIGHVYWVLRKQ